MGKKGWETLVYTEVHFLKPKFDIKKFPSGPTEARGITKNKKDNILKLLKVAPAAKKLFYFLDLNCIN